MTSSGCSSAGAAGPSGFYFTLHKVDPREHERAIRAAKTSRAVMVIEPSPVGHPLYEECARCGAAIRSAGRFEEYRSQRYWEELHKSCGLSAIASKRIEWRVDMPIEVLESITSRTLREWERLSVSAEHRARPRGVLERRGGKGLGCLTPWSRWRRPLGGAPPSHD